MSQSRVGSLVEQCCNVGSGYVLAYLLGLWLYPKMGHPVTPAENFWITNAFTVLSLARGYCWRRVFNWWVTR